MSNILALVFLFGRKLLECGFQFRRNGQPHLSGIFNDRKPLVAEEKPNDGRADNRLACCRIHEVSQAYKQQNHDFFTNPAESAVTIEREVRIYISRKNAAHVVNHHRPHERFERRAPCAEKVTAHYSHRPRDCSPYAFCLNRHETLDKFKHIYTAFQPFGISERFIFIYFYSDTFLKISFQLQSTNAPFFRFRFFITAMRDVKHGLRPSSLPSTLSID